MDRRELTAFCGTRNLVTMSVRARYLSVFWATLNLIHAVQFYFFKILLNIFHVRLGPTCKSNETPRGQFPPASCYFHLVPYILVSSSLTTISLYPSLNARAQILRPHQRIGKIITLYILLSLLLNSKREDNPPCWDHFSVRSVFLHTSFELVIAV